MAQQDAAHRLSGDDPAGRPGSGDHCGKAGRPQACPATRLAHQGQPVLALITTIEVRTLSANPAHLPTSLMDSACSRNLTC